MADTKSGFHMVAGDRVFNVFDGQTSIGIISRWNAFDKVIELGLDYQPGEWVFYPIWSKTHRWSADSLSDCKKKAKQAYKDWLKSQKK